MADFIYSMPNIVLFCLISSIAVIISIIGVCIVNRFVSLKDRYEENGVMGYIGGTITIIYTIVAGFTILYVYDNFNKSKEAVQQEASIITNLYRYSTKLTNPLRTQIQTELKNYLLFVKNTEWILMQQGKEISDKGDIIIDKMTRMIDTYQAKHDTHEQAAIDDLSKEFNLLYSARETRILLANSALRSDIWLVLTIGLFFSIAVNYFFGMRFWYHIFSIIGIAIITSAIFFLIMELDRPFRGEFSVTSEPLDTTLNRIKKM